MNFQQLRYVRAALHNDLNLTEVANQLFTSQSGVSKQIRDLEAELGIDIFVRRGKRLVGVTKAGTGGRCGRTPVARADNLKRLSAQFVAQDKGRLTIAATHNQASYVLPPVLRASRRNFPMWRSKSSGHAALCLGHAAARRSGHWPCDTGAGRGFRSVHLPVSIGTMW
jgi:LysR family cys regulon transcriptional activator